MPDVEMHGILQHLPKNYNSPQNLKLGLLKPQADCSYVVTLNGFPSHNATQHLFNQCNYHITKLCESSGSSNNTHSKLTISHILMVENIISFKISNLSFLHFSVALSFLRLNLFLFLNKLVSEKWKVL